MVTAYEIRNKDRRCYVNFYLLEDLANNLQLVRQLAMTSVNFAIQ